MNKEHAAGSNEDYVMDKGAPLQERRRGYRLECPHDKSGDAKD